MGRLATESMQLLIQRGQAFLAERHPSNRPWDTLVLHESELFSEPCQRDLFSEFRNLAG